jgi:hypothetical protein
MRQLVAQQGLNGEMLLCRRAVPVSLGCSDELHAFRKWPRPASVPTSDGGLKQKERRQARRGEATRWVGVCRATLWACCVWEG